MENKRADHCFSTHNDIANDGGAASTGPKHSRTSAVNDLQRRKKTGANQICRRATIFDATPHAVHLSLQNVLRLFFFLQKKRKTKQKAKTWKSAFPHGRAKVALCGWPDDQHEPPIHGGIRAALRSTRHCESKHRQTRCLKWCGTMRRLLRLIMC